ncbi:MAG TPA: RNA polymerase sigma factor [Candidatus Aminicenantes bacterium]|nr:RNA polymerase sigma factor [Candidatus Aminicenantes bacterium]
MTDRDLTAAMTDEELAREARAGSRRSFEELAARYRRRLFVYLRPRLASAEDAEDLVQETLLKLYRNIGSYDPACRFSTWLYTSAHRLAIDAFRRGAAKARLASAAAGTWAQPAPGAGGEGGAAGEAGPSGLWEAARALGGDRFRVLWLRYGEDLTIAEIAAVLGRTGLAVRVLLHRARTELARRLGPDLRPLAPVAVPRPAPRH